MLRKKSVSAVIATILLILISVTSVVLIYSFIIPMIRENLTEGEQCFKARDHLRIVDSDFTCSTSTYTTIMVKRGLEDVEISGFVLSLLSGASSTSYEIKPGTLNGVQMYNETNNILGQNLGMPDAGEARTYYFQQADVTNADIGVLLENGKICKTSSALIPPCPQQ